MIDQAFQLLQAQLNDNGDKNSLWLVDENITAIEIAMVSPVDKLLAISNRYEVHAALQQRGFNAQLTDYDFSTIEQHSLDAIYYRVSKEKALVHYVINTAAEYLKPDGLLLLSGHKKEGIKTYVDKAANYLGELQGRHKGSNSAMLAKIARLDDGGEPLDDRNYRQTATIKAGEISFITKPGIYGWNKVDSGSQFLIDFLPGYLRGLAVQPLRVVDLGCGYGYLSVMASQHLAADFIATDNNVASVALCQQNFSAHSVAGTVLLDDCGQHINQQADLVLCNPPFHQGFELESDLTSKFIDGARRLLGSSGRALFVVNSFIPLEKKARGKFSAVTRLANNGSFKLVELSDRTA